MYHTFIKITSLLSLLLLMGLNLQAQEVRPDNRSALQKEDGNNKYRSDEINQLDLIHAMDFMGVQIRKFQLGEFDQKYALYIFAETYEYGEVVKIDTILNYHNEYHYYTRGETDYYLDYIDQLKFISKTEDNRSELRLHTYAMSSKKEVELKKWDDQQFYNWRYFTDTQWKLNKKIPLMVFASSWEDRQYKFHRFCGVVNLKEGDPDTKELLQESPTYILFSYQVKPENKS